MIFAAVKFSFTPALPILFHLPAGDATSNVGTASEEILRRALS